MLDESVRNHFPFFTNNDQSLAYFDNAATTQKPANVLKTIQDSYINDSYNVHRSGYTAAQATTDKYEAVRKKVAKFINAPNERSIIFTRGTTDGLNLIVNGYFKTRIKRGDEIVVAISEHHSNLLPWMQLANINGARLRYLEIDASGRLDIEQAQRIINDRTSVVAVGAVSNVLGTLNPVKAIGAIAHAHGAQMIVDAAQAVAEIPVDVNEWNADWIAFSGHKMLGPTGIGVLYGRIENLSKMLPIQLGGEMVEMVMRDQFTVQPIPWRLEAGTPNIIGVLGLGAAIDYLNHLGMNNIQVRCQNLGQSLYDELAKISGVSLCGPKQRQTGIVSFNVDGVHPHDVATILDMANIAVRAGYHCAEPLMHALGTNGAVRASAYIYNSQREIDRLVNTIREAKEFFVDHANQ